MEWITLLTLFLVPAVCKGEFKCTYPKCQCLNTLESHNELPLTRSVPTTIGGPHVYCYQALHPYNPSALLQIWSAVTVSVATDTGFPPSVELVLLENGTMPSPLGPHGSALILSPFRESCVEVRAIGPTSSSNPDTYSLMVRHKTKLRYLALMAIGLILFFGAPSASRNLAVYYSSSVVLGVMLSLLLLLFIFSRMIPKTSMIGWGVLVGGYTIAASVTYWMWLNSLDALVHFWRYVAGYVAVAGLVTFAVVYRLGTPDPRTMNLIQWGAQLVALALVYASLCQLPVVALSGVVLAIYWSLFAKSMCGSLRRACTLVAWAVSAFKSVCWPLPDIVHARPQRKPLRPRKLTMEEYRRVGEVETKAALQKLREHCRHSPNGTILNTIGKLQEPKRFLEFLSGKSGVQPCEQFEYHQSMNHLGSHDASHDTSFTTSALRREALHRTEQRLRSDRSSYAAMRSHM